MEKSKRNSKGKVHVAGERAREYRIWRPGDTDEDPPVALENFFPARLEVGAVAWVRPAKVIPKPRGVVDTKRAIGGLLQVDTDFRHWLAARDAAHYAAEVWEHFDHGPSTQQRALGAQNTRRRQRFDARLLKWVNEFGSLDLSGTGEPDYVDAIMQAAHALRAWAIRDLSLPDRLWSSGTFWLQVDGYAKVVNKAAGKCDRDPETGAWEAPTLWSAMCHSIQHAPDFGWQFEECEADDCFNVFLKRRTEHVTCSQRCGKRKRDHEKRGQQSR